MTHHRFACLDDRARLTAALLLTALATAGCGSAAMLDDVVARCDRLLSLGLTADRKADLVQYSMSS
jgi:hypothetical protein